MVEHTKKLVFNNVLIPWYPISYLTIASSVFFLGAYLVVPAADWGWGRSLEARGRGHDMRRYNWYLCGTRCTIW